MLTTAKDGSKKDGAKTVAEMSAEDCVGTEELALTFEETVAFLRVRAERSEGNFRQALALLIVAEQLHWQIGRYQNKRNGIKVASLGGNHIGVKLSHLQHSMTRTTKSRDCYLADVGTALTASSV